MCVCLYKVRLHREIDHITLIWSFECLYCNYEWFALKWVRSAWIIRPKWIISSHHCWNTKKSGYFNNIINKMRCKGPIWRDSTGCNATAITDKHLTYINNAREKANLFYLFILLFFSRCKCFLTDHYIGQSFFFCCCCQGQGACQSFLKLHRSGACTMKPV